MEIRCYQSSDCKEIVALFYQTVHTINAKDYCQDQLNAWAPDHISLEQWDQSLKDHNTLVAVEDGIIVGFGDIDNHGYLDRLYVHKAFQNRGIATALCNQLERFGSPSSIVTHASITAKPFFEHRGYQVVQKQTVERNHVLLTNYRMEKPIKQK